MSKQNRKSFLDMLINYAAMKAKELGYDEIIIDEDRLEGVWDEEFTKYLKKTYNKHPEEIEWHKNNENYIEFKFQYQIPSLTFVYKDETQQEGLIEFIFSDIITISNYPRKQKEVSWYIDEVHLWNPAQFKKLYTKLYEDMEKLLQEINQ